jgi:hypothetical protein
MFEPPWFDVGLFVEVDRFVYIFFHRSKGFHDVVTGDT